MVQCNVWLLGIQAAFLLGIGQCYREKGMQVLYQWNTVDFDWFSEKDRQEAIETQKYIPENVAILDTDVFFFHKQGPQSCAKTEQVVFVTTPRVKPGVPAALSIVGEKKRDGNHLLEPFPSWDYHREDNCDGIISVFRTFVDDCGRIWVVDTGNVDNFAGQLRQLCPPKILIFDVKTKALLGRYTIPQSLLTCDSLPITIVVDTRNGKCEDAFAYLADVTAYTIIVFSLRSKTFSTAANNNMYPYPEHGDFDIGGVQFSFMDGIFGLALGPVRKNDRTIYYHSFSSVKESFVRTSVIRDQATFLQNARSSPQSFQSFRKKRISQSAAEAMNGDGIMFFSLLTQNAVACWNSRRDPRMQKTTIVAQSNKTMQFISGMKVFNSRLYALSSRLQNYLFASVPTQEINYRILYGCVPSLIQGTPCENYNDENLFDEE